MCRDGYPHLSKLKTLVIKSKCRINTWFTRHYAFRIVSTYCVSKLIQSTSCVYRFPIYEIATRYAIIHSSPRTHMVLGIVF